MTCITDIPQERLLGKRVLVRVDLNVHFDSRGEPAELFKLQAVFPTIEYLRNSGAVVVLLSHLGRPGGVVDPTLSLQPFIAAFPFSVTFVPDCVGEGPMLAFQSAAPGSVFLLENVRFHAGEELNDISFAQQLAHGYDFFVNEAFAVCHREQSSVTLLPTLLPSYAGTQLIREVETLTSLRDHPQHPALAVIGGAKIETKLPLIELLATRYEAVLVGGRVANEALDQNLTLPQNVYLPTDFPDVERYDIGMETIERYCERLQSAQTIVWNGPMGWFEEEEYGLGTQAVIESIAASPASVKVVGGGETLAAISTLVPGALSRFTFVSTGGGAMLEFLTQGTLPGLESLGKNSGT